MRIVMGWGTNKALHSWCAQTAFKQRFSGQ